MKERIKRFMIVIAEVEYSEIVVLNQKPPTGRGFSPIDLLLLTYTLSFNVATLQFY